MTKDEIERISEKLGWRVHWCASIDAEYKRCLYCEFWKRSPAGEDFSFVAHYTTADDIVKNVLRYSQAFDVDKHIETWISEKKSGVSGIPDNTTLVFDAEAIDYMVAELATALVEAQEAENE